MKKIILKVENLHYTYGNGDHALNGIDVDIYEGEKIAVIGSNGSGKSTFFLNVNGVITAEQGKIIYRGTVINRKNLKELRKNIGIVFQDADNQIIASTVMAEVGFGPMNLKLPKEEVRKRVEEALEYMNITDLKNRPPHYLSGGEKKRVTIADIIAMKSEIVIFDEPTAALDPLNAMMLEEVLAKLASEGKTILISTHDVDFAYRWAERILVFFKGRIIADGTPLEIFNNMEALKQANLKQPTMLEVCELLAEKHLLENMKSYPKNIQELKKILK
ncbi:MAG: energy-coupling factor ABC transporter ATP-binding protein [Clostridium sp.]|jgi:cobalt/nickel transport system ATP-binding protein|uniref:energy-coupling factor ABC transporter ATP-binding protein n=1 Tax=Clostridium sp. TaxID=1506 RepID=UPI0025C1C290|nr:energy-coupling factor ABC transporter ATP-binding protein [Clostridium sp.]MCH3964362.1 energy-coupling factor ABC transporter ATP-binding protein [Clostridium sp.]MCI1715537.1 energy-coupling factor ABC transporter ATP-binding protein [Clostridium sp.]MCI1799671.1 energy-coupling factor ABC transporter ATP-binding protein [Clostridium sp.]MCI1813721.1 energy-coupling factor ABC transporter ATP-binding protein [Clostridium sp.]MCI1870484.1 energy-coupling factor ABC transporter ATP-binding